MSTNLTGTMVRISRGRIAGSLAALAAATLAGCAACGPPQRGPAAECRPTPVHDKMVRLPACNDAHERYFELACHGYYPTSWRPWPLECAAAAPCWRSPECEMPGVVPAAPMFEPPQQEPADSDDLRPPPAADDLLPASESGGFSQALIDLSGRATGSQEGAEVRHPD